MKEQVKEKKTMPYNVLNNRVAKVALTASLLLTGVTTTISTSGPSNGIIGSMMEINRAEAASVFAGGTGTIADPYLVTDAMQLYQMSNYLTSHFKLISNIDLSGINWTPVGTASAQFKGGFDGDNYTINNLTINSKLTNVGLFGYANTSPIKNLTLTNVNVNGVSNVGTVVGNMANGSLENVSVEKGTLVATSTYSGGLVGIASGNSWSGKNLSADISVKGTTFAGGLLGNISGGTMKNVYAKGTVVGTNDVGGIAGGNAATIENVFSTANVEGVTRVAGLVGSNTGKLMKGYATGSVLGTGERVAGLVGSSSGSAGSVSELMALNSSLSGSAMSGGLYHYTGLVIGQRGVIYLPENLNTFGYQAGATNIVSAESIEDRTAFSFLTADSNWVIDEASGLPRLAFKNDTFNPPNLSSKVRYELQDGIIFSNVYDSVDLNNIRNDNAASYLLKEDIILTGTEWEPIKGTFGGDIYGNGNKIIDFSTTGVGMFVNMMDADINGLTFVRPQVKAKTTEPVGILSSEFKRSRASDITILDSKVSAESPNQYNSQSYVGSLFGKASGVHNGVTSINNIFVRGEVSSNRSTSTGGIIGVMSDVNDTKGLATLNGLVFEGTVVATGETSQNTGGLIGNSEDAIITNAYSTGVVEGVNNVGGLIGTIQNYNKGSSALSLAYSTSSVVGQNYVGGLIGNNRVATISNVLALNESVRGTTNVGVAFASNGRAANGVSALDRYTDLDKNNSVNQFISDAQSKSKSTYYFNGFEFGDSGNVPVWGISEGKSVPYLLFSSSINTPDTDIDETVKEAIASVVKAESSKDQADVDAARDLVNNLENGDIKTGLTNRLDAIKQATDEDKALEEAKDAVDNIGDNPTQEELDAAKDKVDELSDGPAKDILLDQIKDKQDALDKANSEKALAEQIAAATKAVEQAENSKMQADVTNAYNLVNKLPGGDVKTDLSNRLDTVQQAIDSAKNLEAVRSLVNKLGGNPTQHQIDQARTAVESLPGSVHKNELTETIKAKQDALDAKIADAQKAVGAISTPASKEELAYAQEKVNLLPAGDIKTNLQKQINDKQNQIDEGSKQLVKAETAVTNAESFPTNYNVTIATKLVEALPNSEEKSALLDRLQAIQDMFAFEKAEAKVKQAENYERDPYLADAIQLVEGLKDSKGKQALKDRIQVILDKLQAIKDAEDAANNADGAYEPTDPTQSVENAIDTIQDKEAQKYFANWNKALLNAENYFSKTTVKNATKYLTDLPSAYASVVSYENIIKELTERTENLKAEEVAVDLFAPVEKAVASYEKYKTSYYLKKAQQAVEALSDSPEKTAFEIRLGGPGSQTGNEPSEEGKLAAQLVSVEKAIKNFEKFKTNFYQKKAIEAVGLLVDGDEKAAFELRLKEVME